MLEFGYASEGCVDVQNELAYYQCASGNEHGDWTASMCTNGDCCPDMPASNSFGHPHRDDEISQLGDPFRQPPLSLHFAKL